MDWACTKSWRLNLLDTAPNTSEVEHCETVSMWWQLWRDISSWTKLSVSTMIYEGNTSLALELNGCSSKYFEEKSEEHDVWRPRGHKDTDYDASCLDRFEPAIHRCRCDAVILIVDCFIRYCSCLLDSGLHYAEVRDDYHQQCKDQNEMMTKMYVNLRLLFSTAVGIWNFV